MTYNTMLSSSTHFRIHGLDMNQTKGSYKKSLDSIVEDIKFNFSIQSFCDGDIISDFLYQNLTCQNATVIVLQCTYHFKRSLSLQDLSLFLGIRIVSQP